LRGGFAGGIMRGRALGAALALAVWLGSSGGAAWADIYLWSDEQGVVHMTDRWDNVPAPMRPRAMVRESTSRPEPAPSPPAPPVSQGQPTEPSLSRSPLPQGSPEVSEPSSAMVAPLPSPHDRVLAPSRRPFIPRPKRLEPPFPHNVRLDPFDPNFVWVGPNRVPKDTFRYPNIPLDKQAQFQERIRQLEQRRSSPGKALPPHSTSR
jgi:hypothetical protein